jgi:hypothetical protein
VELKLAEGEVHVYLEHQEIGVGRARNAEAGASCMTIKRSGNGGIWTPANIKPFCTLGPPRSECGQHGVRVVKLPWTEPSSRFTALLERLVIDWLGAASQKAVGERLGLSWDEIHGIMERAVERGLAVDKVRRKENQRLRAAGDDRLTGTRYDWLRNPAAMGPADRKAFAALRQSGLKTARAWALKETAMALFSYQYERPTRKHFR